MSSRNEIHHEPRCQQHRYLQREVEPGSAAGNDPFCAVDDRIGLLGDPHGNYPWTRDALQHFLQVGVRQIHVLGDFGFVWHGAPREHKLLGKLDAILAEKDASLFITGGNHEGYAALERQFPVDEHGYRHLTDRITFLPRGWRGRTRVGTVVASLGGANSIDRWSRRPPRTDGRAGSWWPQESITEADLRALGTDRVDVLLGHEAPPSAALREHLKEHRGEWQPFEIEYADESQQMFQRAVEQVRARLVISGHHHIFMRTDELNTGPHGESYRTRGVLPDRDGSPDSMAALDVNSGRVSRLLDR